MKDDNKRIRERVPFEIEDVFTHDGTSYTCKCENISMSGVLLDSTEFFPIGTAGTLLITLKSGTEFLEVKGACHVARVIPSANDYFELGLEFESLDSESSIVLFNMVRYQKV